MKNIIKFPVLTKTLFLCFALMWMTACQKDAPTFLLNEMNYPSIKEHQKRWETKRPEKYCIEIYNSNVHYEKKFEICEEGGVISKMVDIATKEEKILNPREAITIDNIFQFLAATNNSIYVEELQLRNFIIEYDKDLSYPSYISFQFKRAKENSYKRVWIEAEMLPKKSIPIEIEGKNSL